VRYALVRVIPRLLVDARNLNVGHAGASCDRVRIDLHRRP
jgi:hypothetical protein